MLNLSPNVFIVSYSVVGTTFFFELATYVTKLLWKTPPCRKTEVTSFLVVVLY